MPRILVVDDEPKIVRLVRDYLEHAGFAVVVARDGREALMRARAEHPDLVVLDRDPFAGDVTEVGAAQVVSTWVDGVAVHGG